jgi:hypothetical protein
LKEAKESMAFSKQPGVYDHIVLNDKLDVAYKNFKELLRQVKTEIFCKNIFSFIFRTFKQFYNSKRNNT